MGSGWGAMACRVSEGGHLVAAREGVSMDERRLAHMRDFIEARGDGFGRVVVV